ncbi:MAG: SGNH/GDSL hydrolase family protein [Bacteroidales bacterium]|nr:SGNH/GDSL hydrolase family protein [Bacteroidales bacterium]MBN2820981.1 SGNH/GDSL hydrolase family protein [Bacteroidales bacterium]
MNSNYVVHSIIFVFLLLGCTNTSSQNEKDYEWLGTWNTSPQLVEPYNMPPEPGLTNNTLRQVLRVSIGGDSLKVRFSNEFSTSPVTIQSAQIAVSKGGSAIDTTTITDLKFAGNNAFTMEPGVVATSDAVSFGLQSRMDVAITIYFGETSPDVTGHPGSRTTSFILPGNNISASEFVGDVKTDHWYVINGIDVKAPKSAGAIAILGNSITDGRGSGVNKQNRWPDILSEQLVKNEATSLVSVLNQGIGGNCVLRECLGPAAIDRFERDVLKQENVRWLIIFEGINDLGQTPDSIVAMQVANDIVAAYDKMIALAHENNILVYGATIMPVGKSFYYAGYKDAARNFVNDWIRNSGKFDAVIDFDKIMRDPNDTICLLPDVHSGDFLHPNEFGYETMGKSIDLKLFETVME